MNKTIIKKANYLSLQKIVDMNILGIIPARYASSRFPGKPLADIAGKTMIQRVYEQASKAIKNIVIATDDKRIFEEARSFGAEVVYTNREHKSGTERCVEALEIFSKKKKKKFDIVVNIQGDEPLISPEAIKSLISIFKNKEIEIATLVNKRIFSEELKDPNIIKVVLKNNGIASYFSRSLIPYIRNIEIVKKIDFYSHLGIYAYRSDILKTISKLRESNTEIAESLEQNRWLENGYEIKAIVTDYVSIGIDTPEDLKNILKQFL